MVRPVAWSKVGTPANVEAPTQRGVNLSVLGCMSWYGLIALSQQVPKTNGSKKRKHVGSKSGLRRGIHKTADVLKAIRDHGHTPLFLP
ncbi:hypothetical protein BDA99DRAFT_564340 [Phascolomyces articulosus]|uniref:Uncharacterized protein n=1 Tax=Phascolomyces articulosus TaxID=60185 RepID=A0AAD5JQN2_9FUNG|nr:hypothetical protein BDA99DRAFT_564340 [Phascolomyces articulosus]